MRNATSRPGSLRNWSNRGMYNLATASACAIKAGQLLAQREATVTPKPRAKPMTSWHWLRTTGCLGGAGVLLIFATVAASAQQQQRECFAVALNPQASLGSILIDKCSGKTWLLG